MTPVSERPALGSLRRMEHEYSFKAELDPGWALRPLALASHKGRTMLVLTDPGGEPLDRLLGKPSLPKTSLRAPFFRLRHQGLHESLCRYRSKVALRLQNS